MGMAASQARWISLAARKTNVEYEGQQINQARTALANQSSELWNRLYKMDVPVPPSTTDFTKTKYTFDIGDSTKTITDIQAADYTDPDDGIHYNSYVTYTSDVIQYQGIRITNSNPQVQHVTDPPEGVQPYYMVGTRKLTCLKDCDPKSDDWTTYMVALEQIAEDWPDSTVGKKWTEINPTPGTRSDNPEDYVNLFFWKDGQKEVNFVLDGDSSTYDTLEYCIAHPDEALHSYYADNQKVQQTLSKYAVVEYDTSGRATTIQLEKSSAVYDLTTSTVTDDDAYADAMNQYYYNKQQYEKKVQDINAKTEQIQTEDRTLELRLKQLDTEQNALQTEMDAVHKVISKNIESTFKTFES